MCSRRTDSCRTHETSQRRGRYRHNDGGEGKKKGRDKAKKQEESRETRENRTPGGDSNIGARLPCPSYSRQKRCQVSVLPLSRSPRIEQLKKKQKKTGRIQRLVEPILKPPDPSFHFCIHRQLYQHRCPPPPIPLPPLLASRSCAFSP